MSPYVREPSGITYGQWHSNVLNPTCGSSNRFDAVLFIEKEGFRELFDLVGLLAKYDIAFESCKGHSNGSCRLLIDELARLGVKVFTLTHIDKAGISGFRLILIGISL